MSLEEVTMYRVVCDADGCSVSAQDDTDYAGWSDPATAIEVAHDADWYVGEFGYLCREHAPYCPHGCQMGCDADADDYCGDCDDERDQAAIEAGVSS